MRMKLANWDIDTGTVIRTVELSLQQTERGFHMKPDNIHSPHISVARGATESLGESPKRPSAALFGVYLVGSS